MNDSADITRSAIEAHVAQKRDVSLTEWLEARSATDIFRTLSILAVLIVFTLWEMNNSGFGYLLLGNGLLPDPIEWFAWVFGAAVPVGYFMFHRQASEHLRAREMIEDKLDELEHSTENERERKRLRKLFNRLGRRAGMASVCAVLGVILALIGVFSNIASKTGIEATASDEINQERVLLRAELQRLRAETTEPALKQAEALRDVTAAQITSLVAEAQAWDLGEARADQECLADLRPRQRYLCNTLNGDTASMGLRNELALHETTLSTFEVKRERIAEINAGLDDLELTEGSLHWKAMETISFGLAAAGDLRIWVSLLISMAVLIFLGFGWDSFLEKREQEVEELYG